MSPDTIVANIETEISALKVALAAAATALAAKEAELAARNVEVDRLQAILNASIDSVQAKRWRVTLPANNSVEHPVQTPGDYNSMPPDAWAAANLPGSTPVVGEPLTFEVSAATKPDALTFTLVDAISGALGNEPQWTEPYEVLCDWVVVP